MEGQRAGLEGRVGGGEGVSKIKQKCSGFHESKEAPGWDWKTRPPVTLTKLLKFLQGQYWDQSCQEFPRSASGVWEDEGSQWSVPLSTLACPLLTRCL